tara:strand:- start:36 stop:440 length:405 start_codon:yes stop_codon:yes gene_type:complete
MPIIQGIRKNPLDLNNNVKIGVAFPLDETNIFASTETFIDQAKSNLINLLLTAPGERVNLPLFGVGIKKLLFEQQIDIKILTKNIQNQAQYYIPNVQVLNASVSRSEDQQTVFVSITYRSILDGTVDTVQLNFS